MASVKAEVSECCATGQNPYGQREKKKKKSKTGTALGFTDDMTLHLQMQGGSGTYSAGA
jgi:hypothetical protein